MAKVTTSRKVSKNNENSEALMRIPVGIASGIILHLWKVLTIALAVVNLILTIISGKRNKEIADFCEIWNTQMYTFARYMIFSSNERPFPFNKMKDSMSKFDKTG